MIHKNAQMLIEFMLLVSSYTLWKHKKTKHFLMFSRGIERDQWHDKVESGILLWLLYISKLELLLKKENM